MGIVELCSKDVLGPTKSAIETTTNIVINCVIRIFQFHMCKFVIRDCLCEIYKASHQ